MKDLERRQVALDKTVGKYRERQVNFVAADCVRMTRFHLLQMGHKPPRLPQYRSMLGARRALERAGGLVAVFDSILPRIAPARMLPGDIAVLPGEGGDAAVIYQCFDKFIGCHQDEAKIVNLVVDLGVLTAAWRA